MLTILGTGLPRTGTKSLSRALEILGYETLHHAPERLPLDDTLGDRFDVYNDVDAVLDAPACHFFLELAQVYPTLRYILTIRDEQEWYASIKRHSEIIFSSGTPEHIEYTKKLHAMLFGAACPHEFLYLRAYRQHTKRVWAMCPRAQTLTINVTKGGWEPLCKFLGHAVPREPFPWLNSSFKIGSRRYDRSE